MDLVDYVGQQEEVPMEQPEETKLDTKGFSLLRGILGVLQYASGARPESLGWISTLQCRIGKDAEGQGPTWAVIKGANECLRWLQRTSKKARLWFPAMGPGTPPTPGVRCEWLRVLGISDSAFGNHEEERCRLRR